MTKRNEPSLVRAARSVLPPWRRRGPLVPVIRLSGPIGLSMPLRSGISAAGAFPLLDKAFAMKGARAVALVINSPGGSPVQSHLIYRRVRALAEEKGLPVYAFIEDVGASGGYMIACAGDEIVADPSSIVGSIGVVSPGFGFDRLIDRIGIDRRVYASGENKVTADPFQPENEEDVQRIRAIQRDVHDGFIALVRERRAGKLGAEEERVFSGEFWTGFRGLELGLVDRLGDARSVLREIFGEEVRFKLVTQRRGLLPGRPGPAGVADGASGAAAALTEGALGALEARLLWARYGR